MKFVTRAKKYLAGRNSRLVRLVAFYLVLVPLFATIYFVVYERHPEDFVFNADVLRAQSENFRLPIEREIERSAEKIHALRKLSQELSQATEVPVSITEGHVAFEASPYHYVFYIVGGLDLDPLGLGFPELPVGSESALVLSIRNAEGNVIGTLESVSPAKLTEEVLQYRRLTTEFTEQAELVLENQRRRLATLTSSYPEVWSYWDFLYFSTITQTTVGYGDILPNSTLVRMLVVVQVIFGLLIIGVLINFVSSELRWSRSSDPLQAQTVLTSSDIEDRCLSSQANEGTLSSDREEERDSAVEIGRFAETQPGLRKEAALEAPLGQKPAHKVTKKRSRSRPHRRR